MNRKQRRAMEKQLGEDSTKNLSEKIFQFSQLPDECNACVKPFDKQDKVMVESCNVVVREDKDTVRLYCPDCWGKAINLIKEVQNDIRIHNEAGLPAADTSKPE